MLTRLHLFDDQLKSKIWLDTRLDIDAPIWDQVPAEIENHPGHKVWRQVEALMANHVWHRVYWALRQEHL